MNPRLTVMTTIRGGVFTRADARACGYPDVDIDSFLATGGWRRIRPGTYAPYRDFAVVTEEMLHVRRTYEVLRAGGAGLVASHQSAAALHALPLWGVDLTRVQVTAPTPRAARVPIPGVSRHVRDPIGPGVQVWNGLRLVSPARAVAEVAATCPPAPAVVVADAALCAGLATPRLLQKAAERLIEGVEEAQRALAHVSAESASVAESRLRLILAEAGLPAPSSAPPPGADAERAGCTLWFPDERSVIEFEPHRPYWREEPDDQLTTLADRIFGAPQPGLPEDPEPLAGCFVSWSDLDDPSGVAQLVRTTFAEAARSTGVHPLDPTRRRGPRLRRRRPERTLTDHDLPC